MRWERMRWLRKVWNEIGGVMGRDDIEGYGME